MVKAIMFHVCTSSPLDENWEERDVTLLKTAHRRSDYAAASAKQGTEYSQRYHGWRVTDFQEAQELKQLLETIDKVLVSVREQ